MNSQHAQDILKRKQVIEARLETSGKKRELEDYLRSKLVDCGWKEDMKKMCLEIIRAKGLDKIGVEELVEELMPKGRAMVPTELKEDILTKVRMFIEKDPDYQKLNDF